MSRVTKQADGRARIDVLIFFLFKNIFKIIFFLKQFFFSIDFYVFVHSAVLGLGCGTQDPPPLMWHAESQLWPAGSSVAVC